MICFVMVIAIDDRDRSQVTSRDVWLRSALPSKAEIPRCECRVGQGPETEDAPLEPQHQVP